jgi:hypothetical protein
LGRKAGHGELVTERRDRPFVSDFRIDQDTPPFA